MKNTNNDYTLQGVYNANSYLGTIAPLRQVFLAMYGTDIIPFSYTGSENIDITDNVKISMKIYDEVVLHPRAYDGAVFDMLSGTGNFAFLQNSLHGGKPVAQFYSSTK